MLKMGNCTFIESDKKIPEPFLDAIALLSELCGIFCCLCCEDGISVPSLEKG
ncbi:unnamed protein product [Moneuplotes crassus]|uniref:Uncharacterized protein n=1 Tax=Euplotes crassus TaxID=5936 RepID=A0AAD1XBZ1_EUPCR|nr:unnamed protein product [Moneuplotes crassus]